MIDSIIGLLICGMGVWLIYFVVQSLTNSQYDYRLDYQLFLQTIESDEFKFQLEKVDAETIHFYSPKTNKKYRLSKYNDTLRLQGATKGHLPVLEHVKKVHWESQSKSQVLIKGEFDNGETFSSSSIFDKT
ncbi:ComGF family competence protein [Lentilactobacillus senioris]|uniref:ComGF family competence protein n=1 Tax=Lentilactobacillus senioris TaxID=931534 RepID=UPI002280BB9E|nr:ComGF family competence protein [Lentilactobacillus senioris]MCY9806728.1 ComGF family competence protein [Lentilactobacillus senioris]